MPFFTILLKALSILLFCGFMAIFIIPKIFFWLFYTIPQIFRFRKIIDMKAIVPVIHRLVVWLEIVVLLYVIAFFISFETGMALLFSPTAIFCWVLALLRILGYIFINHGMIQDEFYNNIFLIYIHTDEKEKYDQYFEKVSKLTYQQAVEAQNQKLNYLQKKALSNRISFLLNNNEQHTEKLNPTFRSK